MNDLLHFAMIRATQIFGGNDGVFSSASFSQAIKKVTGVKHLLDGQFVRAMMVGRTDVELLSGGCHYRVIER